MIDEGFTTEAEYQNHQPWCRARRFGRLNADACNCDLKKRAPVCGTPAIIGTSEDFPLTHRPGEYMGLSREAMIALTLAEAFKAGYHCQWSLGEQRYVFDPTLKPGDPDRAFEAWLKTRT